MKDDAKSRPEELKLKLETSFKMSFLTPEQKVRAANILKNFVLLESILRL